MSMLDRPATWDHETNELRAEECARFLAAHRLIEVSDCERICDRARSRAEVQREVARDV